jgi:hypothetical protein
MMQILEYDEIDPVSALHLSLMNHEFAITPEYASYLRHMDLQSFANLAIYGVKDNTLLGQVGLLQLPMISSAGREDVVGIWAVAPHPLEAGGSAVSYLIEEAHTRMRKAGLRFSTLNMDRFRDIHKLYRQHGYVDMQVWGTALASWEKAHRPTRLRAQLPGSDGYQFVEQIFEKVAADYLGFAWGYSPFARLQDAICLDNVWIIWQNERPIGFALVRKKPTLLEIYDLVFQMGIDVTEAVAALAAEIKAEYVQIKVSRPGDMAKLQNAGWRFAHPDWSSFMVKSLVDGVPVDTARQLFGIGTDKFLIPWLNKFWLV